MDIRQGERINPADSGLKSDCSWVKRAEEKKPEGFVEVPKRVMPASTALQEMVIETGKLKILLPLTINTRELQTILAALGGIK